MSNEKNIKTANQKNKLETIGRNKPKQNINLLSFLSRRCHDL